MADRALTEAERAGLRRAIDEHCLRLDLYDRLLAEHAALREVARAASKRYRYADANKTYGEARADTAERQALAALEAAHPGVLEREG